MVNPVNWLRKPEPGRDTARRFDAVLREQALPLADRLGADLLFVYRPDEISPETEAALSRNRRPLVSWIIDSLSRTPLQASLASHSIANFYIDGGDLKAPKDFWLPLGVDDSMAERAIAPKVTDVLFVGNIARPYYLARRERLEELLRSPVPTRCRCSAVLGTSGLLEHGLMRIRAPFTLSRAVGIEEYARIIAGATICINILSSDGIRPVNDTFWLIPAVGTCQLTEGRDFLAQWLTPDVHYAPFGEGQMIQRIGELLEDGDRTRAIAEEGRREVLEKHTYRHRVQTILGHLGLER